VASKIAERDSNRIVLLNDPSEQALSEQQDEAGEDWYAEYDIPDDLMW
jgi:hypothetical protein